jgi:hypothetical protein
MRPLVLIAAAAAAGVLALGGAGSAHAQGVGVEIYAGPPVTGDYYYGPGYAAGYGYGYGPRVYGYTRRYADPADRDVDVVVRQRGGCGTYYYWNGERCVDARNR